MIGAGPWAAGHPLPMSDWGVVTLSIRMERVAQLIKLEVSDILCNRLSDPRIGLVTVTDVEMTKDLRHARIFVSVYGD